MSSLVMMSFIVLSYFFHKLHLLSSLNSKGDVVSIDGCCDSEVDSSLDNLAGIIELLGSLKVHITILVVATRVDAVSHLTFILCYLRYIINYSF